VSTTSYCSQFLTFYGGAQAALTMNPVTTPMTSQHRRYNTECTETPWYRQLSTEEMFLMQMDGDLEDLQAGTVFSLPPPPPPSNQATEA
jgi:hypothetical protein